MRQAIALTTVVIVLLFARGTNWGEGMGSFAFAPLITFFVLYTILYFTVRWLRGGAAIASYTTSRLNYAVAAFVVASILGQVARVTSP